MAKLYLCPTPIGNLDDISFRVVETLKSVHTICAEDTRHSQKLLARFEISKPLLSYHEHNKYSRLPDIMKILHEGKDVALISDAGTPAISDPGEILVKECIEYGVEVVSLPGPCALITALVASGMSTQAFVFEGFLPREAKRRKEVLDRNVHEVRTLIFYEAPHRLLTTLKYFLDSFGDRRISLCRELTKLHEEISYTRISEAIKGYQDKTPKGEFVLVIEGEDPKLLEKKLREKYEELSIEEHMQIYLDEGLTSKDAMKKVAKDRGVSKGEVYSYLCCR